MLVQVMAHRALADAMELMANAMAQETVSSPRGKKRRRG
ncbi:hypothetical protein A2U01_0106252 [Trifolium medium]|uniref:Uncharacterized protein n=1 Tax=Trifolium medium TaxID=97028 RepID=A0A392V9M6_9FABA|nr:hypothetical protein [Trifolium medium]